MSWFNVNAYRREMVKELSEALEKGTAPWQQPWSEIRKGWPRSAVTGNIYGRTNAMRLYARSRKKGYTDPRWMTYNQALDMGCHVRVGEEGTRIAFIIDNPQEARDINGRILRKPDGTPKMTHDWVTIIHYVFNAEQVIGADTHLPALREEFHEPPAKCDKAERIITESGASIIFGGDKALYDYLADLITLPERETFKTSADYYATALHELSHWTGHKSRLDRDMNSDIQAYPFEELVAEIGSMFVSMETGIDQTKKHFDNHAAYVGQWIRSIKNDKNVLIKAMHLANEAAEYILKHEREREKLEKAS